VCLFREPTARNAASRVVESFLGSLFAERKKAHEDDEGSAANEAALTECRQVRFSLSDTTRTTAPTAQYDTHRRTHTHRHTPT
jgi:hypothetical protein